LSKQQKLTEKVIKMGFITMNKEYINPFGAAIRILLIVNLIFKWLTRFNFKFYIYLFKVALLAGWIAAASIAKHPSTFSNIGKGYDSTRVAALFFLISGFLISIAIFLLNLLIIKGFKSIPWTYIVKKMFLVFF
jgi:hypothetical protein